MIKKESEEDDVIDRIVSEEDDINAGTPVYKIRSYPSDPELETLYSRWKRGQIVIPDFNGLLFGTRPSE